MRCEGIIHDTATGVYSTVKILPALSSASLGTYTAPSERASPRGASTPVSEETQHMARLPDMTRDHLKPPGWGGRAKRRSSGGAATIHHIDPTGTKTAFIA